MKGIKNEIKSQTIMKVRRKEKGAQKAESRNRRLGSQEALVCPRHAHWSSGNTHPTSGDSHQESTPLATQCAEMCSLWRERDEKCVYTDPRAPLDN